MTKNKSKPIALFSTLLLSAVLAQAQQSVNATGGDASGSGGTVAYSLGQVVYTRITDASGTVNQGVQQPYEIFSVGIKETKQNISLSLFPNPTAGNLTLQISEFNNEKLWYQIFDIQGKLLINEQLNAQQTQINTAGLPTATYIINVIDQENQIIQSFKIIKN